MAAFSTIPLNEAPSGLPPDEPEEEPLGVPSPAEEEDAEPSRGPGAMPGIPDEREPPLSA
jgi:hypothetical protein